MKVQLTEYKRLAKIAGDLVPVGADRIATQVVTAVGAFAALNVDTRIVRIATDTACQIDFTGGATGATSEFLPANTVEFFQVPSAAVLTVA